MVLSDNLQTKRDCNDRFFALRYQFKINFAADWRLCWIGSLSYIDFRDFGEERFKLFCYFLKTGIILSSYDETMFAEGQLRREMTAIKLNMEV